MMVWLTSRADRKYKLISLISSHGWSSVIRQRTSGAQKKVVNTTFRTLIYILSPRHTRSSQRKKDFRYFNSKLMRGSQTVLTEVQPLSDILWWVASPGREKRRRGREDGGEEMVTGPLVTLFLSTLSIQETFKATKLVIMPIIWG